MKIITTIFVISFLVLNALGTTYYVATDGDNANTGLSEGNEWETIQYAVTNITAGDILIIKDGLYPERVQEWNPGSDGFPIIIRAENEGSWAKLSTNVTINRLYIDKPFLHLSGFRVTGDDTDLGNGVIFLDEGANNITLTNLCIDTTNSINGAGIFVSQGGGRTSEAPYNDDAPHFCTIISNYVTGILAQSGCFFGGKGTNYMLGNTFENVYQSDFFRIFGFENTVRGNTFLNNLSSGLDGNHPDCFQSWSHQDRASKGHIIERNYFYNSKGGLCQWVESDGSDTNQVGGAFVGGHIVRNNIFVDVTGTMSVTTTNFHIINNTFLRVSDGRVIATYGHTERGYSDGGVFLNNALVECFKGRGDNVGGVNKFDAYDNQYPNMVLGFNAITLHNNGSGNNILYDDADEAEGGLPATFRIDPADGWINGGDLGFVNERLNDVRLLHWSPLRDSGTNTSSYGVTEDFYGNPRSDGAYDIGAVEWISTNTTFHYVSRTNGNNGNSGTSTNDAWATIEFAIENTSAGDSIFVDVGDYEEEITILPGEGGSSGSPKRIVARPALHEAGPVYTEHFRLRDEFIEIEGFRFEATQMSSLGNAIQIDEEGHGVKVMNNWFGDSPFWKGYATINTNTSTLTVSNGVDLAALGFRNGGYFHMGGISLSNEWYANIGFNGSISNISGNVLTINESFEYETNTFPFLFLFAGIGSRGAEAVDMIVSGGIGATNVVIANNTFSNWFGHAMSLEGNSTLVISNYATHLNSFSFIRVNGGDHIIEWNQVRDSPGVIWYSEAEDAVHVDGVGGDFNDFQAGFIHSSATSGTFEGGTTYFRWNWIEGISQDLGQISENVGVNNNYYGFLIQSNVFINTTGGFNGGRNGLAFYDNLFYNVGTKSPRAIAIGGGSMESPSTNQAIVRNVFVDIGNHEVPDGPEGHYSITDYTVDATNEFNFAVGPEVAGWDDKRLSDNETTNYPSSDPLFFDLDDPDGADNIPFTRDDGINIWPSSHIRGIGGLREAPLDRTDPIVHYTISSPVGYFDEYGEDFDPSWAQTFIGYRTNNVRPVATIEPITNAPVTVVFDASASTGRDGRTITNYVWDFGDGNTVDFHTVTLVTNTFTEGGNYTVSLTVEDDAGADETQDRVYRILLDVEEEASLGTPAIRARVIGGGRSGGVIRR